MKVHFIAVGGSAMHNLALAMHKKGYVVTGSDDEIGRLLKQKLELAISNVEEGVGLAGGRKCRK